MTDIEIGVLELKNQLTNHGVRGALAWLNNRTQYRFTSLCVVDNGELRTAYLFDRNRQNNMPCTRDAPGDSYSSLVMKTRQPVMIADALHDMRVMDNLGNRSSQHAIRAYCGFPLQREDGSVCGTICHFDDQPRAIKDPERGMLDAASKLLSQTLNQIAEL